MVGSSKPMIFQKISSLIGPNTLIIQRYVYLPLKFGIKSLFLNYSSYGRILIRRGESERSGYALGPVFLLGLPSAIPLPKLLAITFRLSNHRQLHPNLY